MLEGLFGASAQEKHDRDTFQKGKKAGVEHGILIGMRKHFEMTSELSPEEHEMLIKFLTLHNLVLCYDPMEGGFRVRRNDKVNPRKPTVIYYASIDPADELNRVNVISMTVARRAIIDMDLEYAQIESNNRVKMK